jgi:hypothetical protein
VDPLKKSKAPLFDHAKMAANLTTMTRIPYDAQHLPFTSVRFVKNDTAFEFDVQVPADANVASPAKPMTTEQASRGQQGDEPLAAEQQQQQQQRGGAAAEPPKRRNRTLQFEYDLATARLTLLDDNKDDPRAPRWVSMSPDGKTVVFSRKTTSS